MSKETIEVLEGMTEAAANVVACWCEGNLAGAVNSLESWIEPARDVLAKTGNDVSINVNKAHIEEALRHALAALNTAPCFSVPSLDKSSYELAAELERAILRAHSL